MIFALVGNQNCGKTTLFNQLTGSNQHVGNFPGVTVEQKSGIIRGHSDVSVVDLPGIYSLSPYTSEEMVTRDFILKQKPDGIINIVDATNIERNLYLTLQIIDLGIPTVLALNMMDEMRNNGGSIKIKEFSNELGIPVIPISAVKNEGINELVNMSIQTVNSVKRPQRVDFCQGAVHRCIHGIAHLIEDHAKEFGIPSRFAATKIIEGDEPLEDALHLNQNEKETIEHCINEMESEMHTDREAALADMRYAFIEGLCNDTVIKPVESKESIRSTKIDKVLTNKYFGIPLFLAIMLTVFWLTFSVIGKALSGLLTLGINALSNLTLHGMQAAQINPVMQDLIIHGVFSGVGSVLSFLPIIVTLFLLLSLLEDSGYMARVSFLMDKPLRKLGLSGKSFVPMLIGFGCSVPAIMSTRTLSSERDKKNDCYAYTIYELQRQTSNLCALISSILP
jgi:ferrous iron transport protein B